MSVFRRMLRGGSHRPPVDENQEIVLLVVGIRRTGKSSLIQSLMGEEPGPEICAAEADFCTVKCDIYRVELDGVKFALIDTPGMVTDDRTVDITLAPIKRFLDENPSVNIHGILLTRPGPNTRMLGHEVGPMLVVRGICGDPFLSNLTYVLTFLDEYSRADQEDSLYMWKRNAFSWFPGSKVRLFDRGNPAAILSHYSDMDRKGILRTKTPLLVTELRGDRPVPYDTTAGACATSKASKPLGELRSREAWGRELRWRGFKLLYCIRPW